MNEKLKFGIISLIVIIFQSALKIYGVIITGSLSFLSETVDTLVDIVFVSITLYSIKHSEKPPDYEHMYGHSKVDPIGAFLQGIILINIYILLIIIAMQTFLAGTYSVANANIGLILLIISFSVNLIFSRILIWKGKSKRSPSLEIQGFNLFYDSLRALIVLISFIFAILGMIYFDPILSIVISTWIIIGAVLLAKKGIKDLTDINPVNPIILEEIRNSIFSIEHVNGIEDLKVRATGAKMFLEVHLSVEDHISVIHAHKITKSIRTLGTRFFPHYEVECIIEMNPLGGESTLSEELINLIHSMKTEFPEMINIKDLNIFTIGDKYFLSLIAIMNEALTLEEAHTICTNFENELQEQAPNLSRIITHIESQRERKLISQDKIECATIDIETSNQIKKYVEDVLKSHPHVKGYHGFEFWTTLNYCVLELHVFFERTLN